MKWDEFGSKYFHYMWTMVVKRHRIVDFYLRIWVSALRLNSYSFYMNDLKDGDELKCVIIITCVKLLKQSPWWLKLYVVAHISIWTS